MEVPLISAIIGLHKRDVEEGYRQQRIHLWEYTLHDYKRNKLQKTEHLQFK
jgi:hypothetical protein